MNVVNLDNFFKSNQPCEPAFINLSKKPMEIFPTTPITPRNIRVKHKHCNVFLPVIETMTKKNKVMVKAMDYLNIHNWRLKTVGINYTSGPSLNSTST